MNHTRIKPYLILFLLIAAVYWPLAIFQIQYDFLDCWLPWRHFISKSFHNGIFPLWNPYQQLGYPIHADLQGPIFSFENFITGNLFYTNLFTLQMLVFSYLLVAAFGMYKLCAFLYKSHKAALIIALAYVCGGMFIHHLQHFFSIVSFACFPLSIYFFWQMLQLQKWKYVFGLVPLLTLQFTTGNQTFNIINLHIFVIIAIIFIFQYYKAQYTQGIKIILIRCTTLILLTLLCILPILISYWQTKNLVPRYEGISYEKIIGNSMSLISFSGFFNPFITTQHSDFLDNDPSMTGIFFGYLLLVSSFGFFIFSKSRYKIFIFATLLFFILMALGKNTVFHFFVIKIDPLLGLFRFPSYYMFYVYFILLLIAGYFLRDIFIGKIEFKKLAYILLGSTVIYTFIFFFIVFDKGVFFYYFRHFDFRQAFDSMSLSVSFSIAYILVFIFTLLFAILYIINKINYRLIFYLIICELIIVGNMNLFSVISDRKITEIDSFLNNIPKNFELKTNKVIDDNTYLENYPKGIWRNKEMFLNIVSSEFFNSFYLSSINNYLDSNGKLNYNHNLIQCKASYTVVKFTPNEIVIEVNADSVSKLEILQMNTPQWKLFINNEFAGAMNGNLLNAKVKKGKFNYRFVYENTKVVNLFWVSYIVCLLMFISFVHLHYKNNFKWILYVFLVFVFIIPALVFFL